MYTKKYVQKPVYSFYILKLGYNSVGLIPPAGLIETPLLLLDPHPTPTFFSCISFNRSKELSFVIIRRSIFLTRLLLDYSNYKCFQSDSRYNKT